MMSKRRTKAQKKPEAANDLKIAKRKAKKRELGTPRTMA